MGGRRSYYETLGVSKTATDLQLKHAYRTLAKRFHPDNNPGNRTAEESFKAINEAYGILSDTEKRERYDRLGSGAPIIIKSRKTGYHCGATADLTDYETW